MATKEHCWASATNSTKKMGAQFSNQDFAAEFCGADQSHDKQEKIGAFTSDHIPLKKKAQILAAFGRSRIEYGMAITSTPSRRSKRSTSCSPRRSRGAWVAGGERVDAAPCRASAGGN